jgi:1,4-alpha-glucan branching enzyme
MVTLSPDGRLGFRIFLPHATRVEVLGDFTDWGRDRLTLNRTYPGWWCGSLLVKPGEHQFCYLVDGSLRLADYAADGLTLSAGGDWLSTLRVPDQVTSPRVRQPHLLLAAS